MHPNDGTSPTPDDLKTTQATLRGEIGSTIGEYKLLQKVGEGGFGIVYMADQIRPVKRRVALKVIKPGMDSLAVIARFEAERQALAMMDHPHIASVLDGGATKEGRLYFVMELVKGVPITTYCDKHKLTLGERLQHFIHVCEAVQHAHQKGIIHRDIKPSNVMMTLQDGKPIVKVIDFGLAKAMHGELTDKTLVTAFGQMIGTPQYMSPEQAEMSGLDVDTRSDVYSLGVLLYELLTGTTPLDSQTLQAAGFAGIQKLIREMEPPTPSSRVSSISDRLRHVAADRSIQPARLRREIEGDLDWIVMKALEKDRTRRYESANLMALDITRFLNDELVSASPPSRVYRLQKVWRRNSLVILAATAVLVALMLGTIVSVWQATLATEAKHIALHAQREKEVEARLAKDQRKEALAAQGRANRQRQRAEQLLYFANVSLASQALSDNRLGRTVDLLDACRSTPGEPDHRRWEWRYLWGLSRGDELGTLPRQNGSVRGLAYSPDGSILVSASNDGKLVLWDTQSNQSIQKIDCNTFVASLAFSSTGEFLALATGSPKGLENAGEISLWRIDSDRPDGESMIAKIYDRFDVSIGPVTWLERCAVAFTPDDEALVVGQQNGEILFRDHLRRRDHAESFKAHDSAINALSFSTDGKYLASGGHGNAVKIWEIQGGYLLTHKHLFDVSQQSSESSSSALAVFDLKFSSLGLLAACGSFRPGEVGVRIWDSHSGRPVRALTAHDGWVGSVAFSPNGSELISVGASDQSIRIWDVDTWEETAILKGHLDEIWTVAISPDGERLATGGRDHEIKIWAAKSPSSDRGTMVFRNLSDVVFSSDSKTFLTVHRDKSTHLWNSESLQEIREYESHMLEPDNIGQRIALSGKLLAIGHGDESIRIRNVRSVQAITVLSNASPHQGGFVFSNDSSRLAFSSADLREVRLLKMPRGDPMPSLLLDRAQRPQLFSPDSRHLLAKTDSAGEGALWDLATSRVTTFQMFEDAESAQAAFSPDGRTLAATTPKGLLRLFEITGSGVSLRWEVNPGLLGLFGLGFSPQGDRIVVVSGTGKVWLCEPTTGQEVASFSGPAHIGSSATFSPSGNNLLVFFGSEGVLRVHRAPSTAEIENIGVE